MYRVILWVADPHTPYTVLAEVSTQEEAKAILNRTAHELQRDYHLYVYDQLFPNLFQLGKRRGDAIEYAGGIAFQIAFPR